MGVFICKMAEVETIICANSQTPSHSTNTDIHLQRWKTSRAIHPSFVFASGNQGRADHYFQSSTLPHLSILTTPQCVCINDHGTRLWEWICCGEAEGPCNAVVATAATPHFHPHPYSFDQQQCQCHCLRPPLLLPPILQHPSCLFGMVPREQLQGTGFLYQKCCPFLLFHPQLAPVDWIGFAMGLDLKTNIFKLVSPQTPNTKLKVSNQKLNFLPKFQKF